MKSFSKNIIHFCFYVNLVSSISMQNNVFDGSVCKHLKEFNTKIKPQITRLSADAQNIIKFVVNGTDSGVTYQELEKFADRFGPRLSGTQNLENSIDYLVNLFKKERHDKVYTENVQVPFWIRGNEWAQVVVPFNKSMSILGIGGSVGTDGVVLTADVVVVKDFDELKRRSNEVMGKFVVFNYVYESYLKDRVYRTGGADAAAKYGAKAALVRSVTPFSIYSPHTGGIHYRDSTFPKIPSVSITVEDAELFQRLTSKGHTVRVSLYMDATNRGNKTSRNTISELIGTKYPDHVVLVSGHIDSWDVGQGVVDDGGAAFTSWRALSVLKRLGLKPIQTIRSVLWTGEEFGLIGAEQYSQRHREDLNKISIALELDGGTFAPLGLFVGNTNSIGLCILNEVLQLLKPLKASRLRYPNPGPNYTDVDILKRFGVPIGYLDVIGEDRFFYFQHTNGDTMTVENSQELDLCTAAWAVITYALASINILLPRIES